MIAGEEMEGHSKHGRPQWDAPIPSWKLAELSAYYVSSEIPLVTYGRKLPCYALCYQNWEASAFESSVDRIDLVEVRKTASLFAYIIPSRGMLLMTTVNELSKMWSLGNRDFGCKIKYETVPSKQRILVDTVSQIIYSRFYITLGL